MWENKSQHKRETGALMRLVLACLLVLSSSGTDYSNEAERMEFPDKAETTLRGIAVCACGVTGNANIKMGIRPSNP